MGWKMNVRKADGSKQSTHFDKSGKETVVSSNGSYGAVISKEAKKKMKVAYNFGPLFGGTLSKKDREEDINRGLNRLRSQYRSTGGMSKDGTRKHVASIPEELWYSEKAENGPGCFSDPKHLERFVDKWGLRVSGRRR